MNTLGRIDPTSVELQKYLNNKYACDPWMCMISDHKSKKAKEVEILSFCLCMAFLVTDSDHKL